MGLHAEISPVRTGEDFILLCLPHLPPSQILLTCILFSLGPMSPGLCSRSPVGRIGPTRPSTARTAPHSASIRNSSLEPVPGRARGQVSEKRVHLVGEDGARRKDTGSSSWLLLFCKSLSSLGCSLCLCSILASRLSPAGSQKKDASSNNGIPLLRCSSHGLPWKLDYARSPQKEK